MKKAKRLHIFLTWSPQKDKLYVGDIEHKIGLISAESETLPTKVIKTNKGSYILLGDKNAEPVIAYVKIGKKNSRAFRHRTIQF